MYKTQNNLYFLNINSRISCRDRGCRTIAKIPSCHICRKNKKEAQSNIKDQLKRESEKQMSLHKKVLKYLNVLIVTCIFWSFHTYIYVNRRRQTQHILKQKQPCTMLLNYTVLLTFEFYITCHLDNITFN